MINKVIIPFKFFFCVNKMSEMRRKAPRITFEHRKPKCLRPLNPQDCPPLPESLLIVFPLWGSEQIRDIIILEVQTDMDFI